MYSVATLTFGRAAHLAFMEPLTRFMPWFAVAAWALVAAAFLSRLARHPQEAHPEHRRRSSGTARAHDTTDKELA